jgi:hypothetical protein
MDTEVVTAWVVVILAVILGVRRIVRGLSLLTEDSRRFIIVLVSFSQEGRALRGELRKWRGRRRRRRTKRPETADRSEA